MRDYSGEIDARELKAIMKAFGMEIKKQDVRDIYGEMGKEIKEGLNFNEFVTIMNTKMVPNLNYIRRAPETPKTKSTKSSSFSTRTASTKSASKTSRESPAKLERKSLMTNSEKCSKKPIEMAMACSTSRSSTGL